MKLRHALQMLRYEIALWKALFGCVRSGHHMVGMGRTKNNGPYYCWKCFYKYPNQIWARNFIGRLVA